MELNSETGGNFCRLGMEKYATGMGKNILI